MTKNQRTPCQPQHNVWQPELVSGSNEILKQVRNDKNRRVQHDKLHC